MSDSLPCQSLLGSEVHSGKRISLPGRALKKALHFPILVLATVRARPRRAFFLLILLIVAVGVGVWSYAVHQWRAAQVAVRNDRPTEAQERLKLCLRVWPRNPEVHLLAARTARLTGDFTVAESHLNRCLELQRGATEAVQLEFLLMRTQAGEMDTLAPVLFALVDKGHPESTEILDTLARSYMHHLRYKPAYACLSRWITLQPNNVKPYHWRGWVLEHLNNPKLAREDYERALELDPDLLTVRLRFVEILLEDKLTPDALPHLEYLARQAPDDMRVKARLGMCRFFQGNNKDARHLMETALPNMPDDPSLLISLANLDLQEGRATDAERRLRKLLETDPSETEALFILASALQFQSRENEAAAVLAEHTQKKEMMKRINALLKDVADSPTATANDYAELGGAFLQLGRDRVAVYWLELALERDSTNQRAHLALSTYYAAKGDQQKAQMHRREARTDAPISPSVP